MALDVLNEELFYIDSLKQFGFFIMVLSHPCACLPPGNRDPYPNALPRCLSCVDVGWLSGVYRAAMSADACEVGACFSGAVAYVGAHSPHNRHASKVAPPPIDVRLSRSLSDVRF
eukprot:45739-Rhodomonas_salina.5